MKIISILFVIAPLGGGPKSGISKLLLYINKNRFELTVAYFHIQGITNIPESYWEELRRASVAVRIFPMRHRLDFTALFRFFIFLTKTHFDILYLPFRVVDSIVSLMARVLGIPVLVSKHGFPQHNTVKSHIKLPWYAKPVMHISEKLSTSLATRVRTVSESNKLEYIRLFGVNPTKIVVIPNGLELEKKSKSTELLSYRKSIAQETSNIKLIGLVGNLVPIKGHSTYIRAAALIKKIMPDVKWLIVADITEKMRPYYRELAILAKESGVEDMVQFVSYRPDVYAILDIVVVPSFIEDCPHVVLEAMKYGKAVVASMAGGIPELVADNETGLLFAPQDHQELADKVLYLLQNMSETRSMGIRAHERLENNFSINKVVKAIEKEFENIAKLSTDTV